MTQSSEEENISSSLILVHYVGDMLLHIHKNAQVHKRPRDVYVVIMLTADVCTFAHLSRLWTLTGRLDLCGVWA